MVHRSRQVANIVFTTSHIGHCHKRNTGRFMYCFRLSHLASHSNCGVNENVGF